MFKRNALWPAVCLFLAAGMLLFSWFPETDAVPSPDKGLIFQGEIKIHKSSLYGYIGVYKKNWDPVRFGIFKVNGHLGREDEPGLYHCTISPNPYGPNSRIILSFQPPKARESYNASGVAHPTLRISHPPDMAHISISSIKELVISWTGGIAPYRVEIRSGGQVVYQAAQIPASEHRVDTRHFKPKTRYRIFVKDSKSEVKWDRPVLANSWFWICAEDSVYFDAES